MSEPTTIAITWFWTGTVAAWALAALLQQRWTDLALQCALLLVETAIATNALGLWRA